MRGRSDKEGDLGRGCRMSFAAVRTDRTGSGSTVGGLEHGGSGEDWWVTETGS